LVRIGKTPLIDINSCHIVNRLQIEHNCLQDLIHHSIHVKNTRILKAVQHILARIVEEKVRIKQLDDLLTRLYEPIIWRSLKVANPRVRCNAAIQLGYVFPLLPANLPPRLMQEQLEEQLEHVKQLQNDPVPLVRVKGVLATGRILSLYWELVPTVYQSSLLLHLIDELAFDASDYRVREAVFQALRLVLDNHLSHGFLKAHLPRLAVLMHDSSEKVRLAFVLLLNEIKRIKAIKFWEVVPIDHLLARLREESLHSLQDGAALTSVESSKVVEGLVALLSDTYFPVKKPASQWVIRCIALVEADHMAALEFFRALAPQLVPSIAVKFIGKLFKKILVPWYKLKVTGVASKPSNDDASEVGEDDQEPNAKRAKTSKCQSTSLQT
jgi:condensin-2 complex subunit G2